MVTCSGFWRSDCCSRCKICRQYSQGVYILSLGILITFKICSVVVFAFVFVFFTPVPNLFLVWLFLKIIKKTHALFYAWSCLKKSYLDHPLSNIHQNMTDLCWFSCFAFGGITLRNPRLHFCLFFSLLCPYLKNTHACIFLLCSPLFWQGFATSISIILSAIISFMYFDFVITNRFGIGAFFVIASTVIYSKFRPAQQTKTLPVTSKTEGNVVAIVRTW